MYEGSAFVVVADWLLAPWCSPAPFFCKHDQTARTTEYRLLALTAFHSHSLSKHEAAARGLGISKQLRRNYTRHSTKAAHSPCLSKQARRHCRLFLLTHTKCTRLIERAAQSVAFTNAAQSLASLVAEQSQQSDVSKGCVRRLAEVFLLSLSRAHSHDGRPSPTHTLKEHSSDQALSRLRTLTCYTWRCFESFASVAAEY